MRMHDGLTAFSLFAGSGLADVGLAAAGFTSVGGLDTDPDAVAVAQANGLPVVCADVLTADPHRFERPTLLWASPPCDTASLANAESHRRQRETGSRETAHDQALAAAVVRFLTAMQPAVFVLENVQGYRSYRSYATILTALHTAGYQWRDWVLNAADYGVPQQRRRLILIAARRFVPNKPPPTHHRTPPDAAQTWFVPPLLPWQGWYQAIADLLPDCPPAELAPWQLRRLPAWLTETVLHMTGNTQLPDPTGTGVLTRAQPANTVRDYGGGGGLPTALLVDDQFSGTVGTERRPTTAEGSVPAFTVTTRDSQRLKAVLLDQVNGGRRSTSVPDAHPAFTVTCYTEQHPPPRAVLVSEADVRSLTPRALARLQSVPDCYELPDQRRLACSIIGRGVPCLLAQAIGEAVRVQMKGTQ